VVLDAVSAVNHLANQGRIFCNRSTNTEETGFDVVSVEHFENARRTLGIRAVVKGQSHGLRTVRLRLHPRHIGSENSTPGEKPPENEAYMVDHQRPNGERPQTGLECDRTESEKMHNR
jgi:hypothetical protein